MKIINILAEKELWFVILLLSGFFKQFVNVFNLVSFDVTLVVSCLLLIVVFYEHLFFYNGKFTNSSSLIGILSLCLFTFFTIFSITYTPSEQYALKKFLSFLICIFIYLLPQLFIRFDVDIFIRRFVNISIILSIIFVLVFYFIPSNSPLGVMKENYLVVGYLCGLNILILFAFERKISTPLVFFIIVLMLTGARGPLIFTVATSALIWINMFGFLKLFAPKTLLFIFILMSIVLGLAYFFDFIYNMLLGSFNRLSLLFSSDIGDSANIRIHHILESWQHIKDKPLFGYGFGSYGLVTTGTDIRSYPHNIFLELWFEVGIFGLLSFLFFCVYHFRLSYLKLGFPAACILLYIILNSLKSSSFAEVKFLFSFMSIFILLGGTKNSIRFN
ncbi:conserved membrane hypothetical protein [Vibrio rotiferianus]|nr:conserved membrane hypothetical protein [Vibrio rotiferianus]